MDPSRRPLYPISRKRDIDAPPQGEDVSRHAELTPREVFSPDRRHLPALKNKRAARDAEDLPVLTVHVRKQTTHGVVFRECRFISGVPHAAFNRPYSTAAPAELPSLPFGRGPFIRRWRAAHQGNRVWDTESSRPVGSVPRGQRGGQLWLQPPIIACERQSATAPDPHFKTPLETPLTKATGFGFEDRDGRMINPLARLGIRNPKIFSR